MTLEEREANIALARMQRETAIATKKIAMDEMSHASRWIMASVLAINSGGLIACLGKIDTGNLIGIFAAVAFYGGVALAMFAGWRQIKVNQQMLPLQSRHISVWENAAIDGVVDGDELKKVATDIVAFAKVNGGMPAFFCKLSFVAFGIGLSLLAFAANKSSAVADHQTAATANDR